MILLTSFIFLMMLLSIMAFIMNAVITAGVVGIIFIVISTIVFKAWLDIIISALIIYIFREELIGNGSVN